MIDPVDEIVRTSDRLRYTASLYAPEERRKALLALFAFNVEVSRIRDAVREPMAGEMRLRWWRDAIGGRSETESAGHPVAAALRSAIENRNLPIDAFGNMLEARRLELYGDPIPTRADLEGYCGETAGALIRLSGLILDKEAAIPFGGTAGHAGCAMAIAGLLSLLPVHRGRGQCFIPLDMLSAAGATVEDMIAPEANDPALRAVNAMIALGREHAARFERRARELPQTLRPAHLPAATAGAWLRGLERAGGDVFRHPPALSPLRQSAIVFRRAMFGWR